MFIINARPDEIDAAHLRHPGGLLDLISVSELKRELNRELDQLASTIGELNRESNRKLDGGLNGKLNLELGQFAG